MSSIMRVVEKLHPWASLRGRFGRPVERITHLELNTALTFYEPGAGLPPPRLSKVPSYEEKQRPGTDPEFWSVECRSLTEFGPVKCRNVDADYQEFTAMSRIAFGAAARPSEGGGPLEPKVYARLLLSQTESEYTERLTLPLEPKYLFQTWTVHNTRIGLGDSTLWVVPGNLDYSVAHIFVYDITEDSRVTPFEAIDYEEIADRKLLLDTCRLFSPHSKGRVIQDEESPVAKRFFLDNLLRAGGGVTTTEVGKEARVRTVPRRIVVALTLTCHKQTDDFQPSPEFLGVAGACRFWPVMQVAATHPVVDVEGTIEIDRPSVSEWGAAHGCHGDRHISPLLVTDTNRGARGTPLDAPLTHWSVLFNYFLPDAATGLGSRELHVVKAWKPGDKDEKSDVVRRPPWSELLTNTILIKAPRQGEFDNVHWGPKMSIVGVTHFSYRGGPRQAIVDRVAMKLDDISMAPICAHDCLHFHWRWTDVGAQPVHFGFLGHTPCLMPGAPMVPEPQDVWLWFRGKEKASYHVRHYEPGQGPVRDWVPFFHHGGAYLTYSVKLPVWGGMQGAASFSHVAFYRDDNPSSAEVTATDDWAVFYWNVRYYMMPEFDEQGRHYRVLDRTSPTTAAGLLRARKL